MLSLWRHLDQMRPGEGLGAVVAQLSRAAAGGGIPRRLSLHSSPASPSRSNAMNVSIVCSAILGLLLFGLGLYVSILRQVRGRIIGHDLSPTDTVHRAVRAHANTAEYVPILVVLFLWHGAHAPTAWIIATIMVATAARFLLVAGLLGVSSLDKPNPARFLGALLTYLCGLALAAAMLAQYV
jgi:uncharacterized membrane protein YecN with MAPEG domain